MTPTMSATASLRTGAGITGGVVAAGRDRFIGNGRQRSNTSVLIREGPHPWSGFASVRSLRLEKWESHGCKAGARMKREEPIRSGISITVVNGRTGIFRPIDASCRCAVPTDPADRVRFTSSRASRRTTRFRGGRLRRTRRIGERND